MYSESVESKELVQRKLAAIMSADVAGYSRLMGLDEAETLKRLSELRRAVDGLIEQRGDRYPCFEKQSDGSLKLKLQTFN
jgi:adenylate cyclase